MSRTVMVTHTGAKLTHAQQLARVREFFQSIDPSHWGQGVGNHEAYAKAERQRKAHENNLRNQRRLKLR